MAKSNPPARKPPVPQSTAQLRPPDPKLNKSMQELATKGPAAIADPAAARAAADQELPAVEPMKVVTTRGRCPHCKAYPLRIATTNYETAGIVPGSIELWRMLVCSQDECHAVVGMALVNIQAPKSGGGTHMQTAPPRR